METYISYYNFAYNGCKKDIFKLAYEYKDDKNVILGLLDGIILRDDDILKGFIKQFKHTLDDEDLQIAIEHSCLSNRPNSIAVILPFIQNKEFLLRAYEFCKTKHSVYAEYLKPYTQASLHNATQASSTNTTQASLHNTTQASLHNATQASSTNTTQASSTNTTQIFLTQSSVILQPILQTFITNIIEQDQQQL